MNCTVEGFDVSFFMLEYEWTIGGEVEQNRSSSSTFLIRTTQVTDARDDYGCDVFAGGATVSLLPRGTASLSVTSMVLS